MREFLLAAAFYRQANYLEAGLWIAIAAIFVAYCFIRRGQVRRMCAVSAVVFFLFGLSDVAEACVGSGSWWEPWWLLLWKSLGVLALLALLIQYLRMRRET